MKILRNNFNILSCLHATRVATPAALPEPRHARAISCSPCADYQSSRWHEARAYRRHCAAIVVPARGLLHDRLPRVRGLKRNRRRRLDCPWRSWWKTMKTKRRRWNQARHATGMQQTQTGWPPQRHAVEGEVSGLPWRCGATARGIRLRRVTGCADMEFPRYT